MGWYGHGNIGDELLMCSVTRRLQRELVNPDLTVFSANPGTAALLTKCRSSYPFTPHHPLMSFHGLGTVLGIILKSRCGWPRLPFFLEGLVVGGGSILGDRDPTNLPMWHRLVRLCKRLGTRVYFYGISVGPIRETASLQLVRDILMSADGSSFRDAPSVHLMREHLPQDRLVRSADPVLSLFTPYVRTTGEWPPRRPLKIGFNVRRISSIVDSKIDSLGLELATALLRNFDAALIFLPMKADDLMCARRLRALLPSELAKRFSIAPYDLTRLDAHIELYRNLDVVVSMRLHAAILAVLHDVPVLGLDCNAKIPGFLEQVGLGKFVSSVSDGISEVTADAVDVVTKLETLIDSWPAIRSETRKQLLLSRAQESLNIAGLRRAFGIPSVTNLDTSC
jgi:polysaccharide pyruvyl transferase WcaK-like protein